MTPIYSKQAAKYINGLNATSQQRIRQGISKIPDGDIKPLKGMPGNYRLRIGDWRVLFDYADGNIVRIKKISPRGQAYKGVK